MTAGFCTFRAPGFSTFSENSKQQSPIRLCSWQAFGVLRLLRMTERMGHGVVILERV